MAAKVKFDASSAAGRLKTRINKLLKEPKLESEIGVFLTERVRFEARRGRPLNKNRKFPSLKDGTVEQRKRLEKFNRTQRAYAADKSNLTFTGQYQNALSFERKRAGIFELFIKDSARAPYRTASGRRSKNTPKNDELDRYLREIGYVLFDSKGLKKDKKIPRRIKQFLLRFLRRQLRRS